MNEASPRRAIDLTGKIETSGFEVDTGSPVLDLDDPVIRAAYEAGAKAVAAELQADVEAAFINGTGFESPAGFVTWVMTGVLEDQ